MNNLLYYGLQVIAASGILYGYYHFFLRNKKFHQYNRFYLLAAMLISIVVPFLDIPVYFTNEQKDASAIWLALGSITSDDTVLVTAGGHSNSLSIILMIYYGYILLTTIALVRVLVSLNRIRKLKKTNPGEKIDDILFINTTEKGTPFSFFNLLFWNKEIDLDSSKGEQVFRHELFHIRQYHSIDVIFAELVTVFCWINPFFHIMKKEIKAIHEFLADQYAVTPSREWEYAELLLMQALQTRQSLVNPFFHNQIKRRIAMITLSQQPKHRYFRKIMVLPLLALVLALFAFSYKNLPETTITEQPVAGINPDKSLQLQAIPADTPKVKIAAGKQVLEVRTPVEKPRELLLEKRSTTSSPLVVLDHEIIKEDVTALLKNIDPRSIESVTILKDSKAVAQYGEAGINGVIEIITKKDYLPQKEVIVTGYPLKSKIKSDTLFEERVVTGYPIEVRKVQGVQLKEIPVGELKKVEGFQIIEEPKEITVTGYRTKKDQSATEEQKEIVVTGYPSRKFTTIEDESKSGATANAPAEYNISTDGNIYPNPTSNLVQVPVSSVKGGSGLLQVVDAAGNIVLTQRPALSKGSNTVSINTTSLKTGAYVIKLTTPEGTSRSYKMMKK
jgi:TonB-dependent SusC/RagA subfamily outer membrane receptor